MEHKGRTKGLEQKSMEEKFQNVLRRRVTKWSKEGRHDSRPQGTVFIMSKCLLLQHQTNQNDVHFVGKKKKTFSINQGVQRDLGSEAKPVDCCINREGLGLSEAGSLSVLSCLYNVNLVKMKLCLRMTNNLQMKGMKAKRAQS